MVIGFSFCLLVIAGFQAGWQSLCHGSLHQWSVGWHEQGMVMNHDKCRGLCFYDAPNGPPTPGSPLPLFSIPFSSIGKVQAHAIEPTSLRIEEGLVAKMLKAVGCELWWVGPHPS